MKRNWRRGIALVGVVGLLTVAACGDDGGGESAGGDSSSSNNEETTGQPVSGGTLTMAVFSETSGLDPIVSSGFGTTGGTEMAAIYDTLVRWNPDTRELEPRTAESVETTDGGRTWTVKVRDGITFSDGTAYDAEAVRLGLERHRSPQNRTPSAGYMRQIAEMRVVDPLTLEITLTVAWPGFAGVLAGEAGKIPSPTAVAACGTLPPAECGLNTKPVGAGPFLLESYRPKESITLVRNPDYWGGEVYLDRLVFVPLSGGEAAAFEALKSGDIDVTYFRDPALVAASKDEGFEGFSRLQFNGGSILLNHGLLVDCKGGLPADPCAGQPDGKVPSTPATADPVVRQAIAAAINPDVVNERAYEGHAKASTSLLQDGFPWWSESDGIEYDAQRARELVAEAKASGWDGAVELLGQNNPVSSARTLAIATMLEAAGMTVQTNTQLATADQVRRVIVDRNYEIAVWGGPPITEDPMAQPALDQALRTGSPSNRTGYASAEMDAALDALRTAQDDGELTEAWTEINDLFARDLPWLPESALEEYLAWADDVNGLTANLAMVVYFDKAWIAS